MSTTRGPWAWTTQLERAWGNGWVLAKADDTGPDVLFISDDGKSVPPSLADCRLIAAAPELLEVVALVAVAISQAPLNAFVSEGFKSQVEEVLTKVRSEPDESWWFKLRDSWLGV